jgi:hypothetical protein
MAHIRALDKTDLPAVASLMREHLPGPAADEGFLQRTLLDDPWFDPDLPSLVAEDDDGRVIGSIASQPRRLSFDGKPIRAVCCSHLVVDPDARTGGAPGALLLGRLLGAGQDLTWSESADDIVVRIWRLSRGDVDGSRAYDWMIILRPGGWARRLATGAIRTRSVDRSQLPVGALPVHAVARGRIRKRIGDELDQVTSEPAEPEAIESELGPLNRGVRLYVAHDADHLRSVFGVIEGTGHRLVRRIVRHAGRAIGWYAYLAGEGGTGQVLHVGAARDRSDAVFADLVRDATEGRMRMLTGRTEPHLLGPLRQRLAIFGLARQPVIHAADPALAAAAMTPGAQISRLDGEWFVT